MNPKIRNKHRTATNTPKISPLYVKSIVNIFIKLFTNNSIYPSIVIDNKLLNNWSFFIF